MCDLEAIDTPSMFSVIRMTAAFHLTDGFFAFSLRPVKYPQVRPPGAVPVTGPGRPGGPTGDRTGPGFFEGGPTGHRTGPGFFEGGPTGHRTGPFFFGKIKPVRPHPVTSLVEIPLSLSLLSEFIV